MRTSPGSIGNETLTYTYDIENRLVQRTSNGASSTVTLTYDPLGRLFSLAANGASTQLLYDGDALVAEYGTNGALLRRFVHGPATGTDDPLVWYEGSGLGDRRWLHADELGSIVGVSNSAGTIHGINRFDEYGIPASTNVGRFQYTGQIFLAELGLYYYKARVYSPTLGRFLQTDPIGYEDQFNIYTYVGNDPVNLTDPTGMCSSVGDGDRRADCFDQRRNQIAEGRAYLADQSVRSGSNEAAYIATYNEESGEVTVRTGDAAGTRTNNEVNFSDNKGNALRAQADGRIVERQADGSITQTSEVVLVTGHGHPRESGGGRMNSIDRANERIADNPVDQLLSRIAPALLKTPSGHVRLFVNGGEVR